MQALLDTAYQDTCATDLRFSLGYDEHPAGPPALATLVVGPVLVRILGASHQVVVATPTGPVVETVACLPGLIDPLPTEHAAGRYRMSSRVRGWTAAELTAYLHRSLPDWVRDEHTLVARFPGSPQAVTAVSVRQRATHVEWSSWHVYPQYLQVVRTTSQLLFRHPVGPAPVERGGLACAGS